MKNCSKCKKEKPNSEFPFKNKAKGIRSSICQKCNRVYKREYYYRNKDTHYARNKKTELKLREYALSVKDKCVICVETEKCCLDFHHVGEKDKEIAKIIKNGSMKKLLYELTKCVVVCSNCHRKIHAGVVKLASHWIPNPESGDHTLPPVQMLR